MPDVHALILYVLVGVAIVVGVLAYYRPAHSHDWSHQHFAQSTPDQRNWMQRQMRPGTTSNCCSESDGEQVDEEIRAGSYWVNSRHTRGVWLLVPPEAVITAPNPHGRPVAWFRWVAADGSFSNVPRSDLSPTIFCYSPGPLL